MAPVEPPDRLVDNRKISVEALFYFPEPIPEAFPVGIDYCCGQAVGHSEFFPAIALSLEFWCCELRTPLAFLGKSNLPCHVLDTQPIERPRRAIRI